MFPPQSCSGKAFCLLKKTNLGMLYRKIKRSQFLHMLLQEKKNLLSVVPPNSIKINSSAWSPSFLTQLMFKSPGLKV